MDNQSNSVANQELQKSGQSCGNEIKSIYVFAGGGGSTLTSAAELEKVVESSLFCSKLVMLMMNIMMITDNCFYFLGYQSTGHNFVLESDKLLF